MTMRYIDVALSDLRREFDLARSHPRHLAPQPKAVIVSLRAGIDGVLDALLSAQRAGNVPSRVAQRSIPPLP